MNVHWQINFKSLLGTSYTIDIYDRNYSGSSIVELTGAAEPITTSEDDDEDMYIPIRTQSGYIRFVVENAPVVEDIQPYQSIDRPVVLRAGNNIKWIGFLKPEKYSQPWEPTPYVIELPLMSIMYAMQGVEITQDEGYMSFFSLVRTINTYLPSSISLYITAPEETPVVDVFVQNNNFREFLTVAERNERSTTDIYDCESIYDAVSAFCQYFGFSLHEYQDTFCCVVYPDTDITYEDISPLGDSHESQYSSNTLASMVICGANNMLDYTQAYRRIVGKFETGEEKMGTILSIDAFFKQFAVQGAYPVGTPQYMLFYGNAEILPYKNGTQQTSWLDETVPTDTGGQIIRKRDVPINQVDWEGSSWSDKFYIRSYKSEVGNPETALKFIIPQYVYINDEEYAALNISGDVDDWYYATQSEGFIKKLYCKIKVGNYWLSVVEQTGYYPRYEWTTTETSCYLQVDNGRIHMKNVQVTLNYRAEADMNKIDGFAIDMPSALDAGYYQVYFELLANAEATADFGEYSHIGYLVSGLEIRVLRGVNSLTEPTPDLSMNTVIRKIGGAFLDDYSIDCPITSERGVQYGTGVALNEDKEYITTKYDTIGIVRRAAIMDKSREMLTVSVRSNAKPIEGVTYNSKNYGILSQSINWRDDVNELRIINLD